MIDFTVPSELGDVLDRLRAFVTEDVVPAEAQIADPADLLGSWEVVEGLRERARELGVYTPHLPERWGGLGLGVLGMSLVNQECGVSMLASLAINAMAPDEGNMHTLLHAGTEAQLERYLRPLAEGRTRSCFAMTEPDVASSDPLNLQTTAVRDGDEWVLNGRKWFITGGVDAAFSIVVARTGDPELRHKAYSLILVDCDTPGWSVVRDPGIIGAHFAGGHPEIELRDVRVPAENVLGEEGAGFAIAQIRLAGGRLAHAMRWIGVSQRALDLTAEHMHSRSTFGTKLADHQGLQFFLARQRLPAGQHADGARASGPRRRRARLGDGHDRRPAGRRRLPRHAVDRPRRPRARPGREAGHPRRGFLTRAELIALYEERSGRRMTDIRWYRTLALWKSVVFMEGNFKRAASGSTDDPYLKGFEEGVPQLARRAEELAHGG